MEEGDKSAQSRRSFLAGVAGVGAMAGLGNLRVSEPAGEKVNERLPICIFSKHLQWLDWEHMAETAAELGFDGIDLTVRQGGHVQPERVKEDLPKVAKIVRKAGLEIPMITADIVDVHSPYAEDIISTASEVGIYRYRWGWFSWSDSMKVPDLSDFYQSMGDRQRWLNYISKINIPDRLDVLKKRVADLAKMNEKYKVCAMYHNHSGYMVGAPIWDLWILLKDFNPYAVGSNFDIGHATVEGGFGGWIDSTRLMDLRYMRGTAIKDFKWEKNAKGGWEPRWCPPGEGMVNFSVYFAMLKQADFSGPVQLHFEYPLGGVDTGQKTLSLPKAAILSAFRRDLNRLKGWMKEAQLN